MAGEYQLSKQLLNDGLSQVESSASMDGDTFATALLRTVIGHLRQQHAAKDLMNLVSYELENGEESEFVITRGC